MGIAIKPSMGALSSLPGVLPGITASGVPITYGDASDQMVQDQGVLRQIADNELMAEVAPLLKGRAVAKLGMDPTRTSFLPHYTPRNEGKWKSQFHPQEGTLGSYYAPRYKNFAPPQWQKDILQDYNLPDFRDRMVVWSDPKNPPVYEYDMDDTPGREGLVTPEVERYLQEDRDNQLATLAHEADHRGAGVMREEIRVKRDALWEQTEAIRDEYAKAGKDGYWRDPRYQAAQAELDRLAEQLPTDRGPRTEELRVRANDASWFPRHEDRREAQKWLDRHYLDIDPRPGSLSVLTNKGDLRTTREDLLDPRGAVVPDNPPYPYTAGVTFQERPYVTKWDPNVGDYYAGPPGSPSPPLTLSQYLDFTGSRKLEALAKEKLRAQGRSTR